MKKVFIGGSRHVSRLNAQVRKRLDNIIDKELPVIIGDANGADKAVQQYLHDRGYRNVEVFCSDGFCRNNLGRWEVRSVPAGTRDRNVTFYSAKDRMMTQEAMVGLMIWDGKSVGTLLNVFRLLSQNKKVVVYTVPEKRFEEIKTGVAGWDGFIARYDVELQHRVEERTTREASERRRLPAQGSLSI